MRKIFIDCGGNKGQSIVRFKKSGQYSKDFEIYSFEPVPSLAAYYKECGDVIYSDKAIWINDDKLDFYIDRSHRRPEGSTLLKEKKNKSIDKKNKSIDKKNPIKVQALDFSKWIIDNFNIDDYIILKMDIEGAEYRVLEKMFADGSIKYIDCLYVEFHWNRMKLDRKIHDVLVKKIEGIEKLKFCSTWNGKFILF